MYRPPNWEKQKVITADIDKFPHKTWDVAHSFGWRDGYEAGADAYEKGLLSQEHQDWLATEEGESCKGTWVFIPKGE